MEVHEFLLQLALVLLAARLFGEVSVRWGMPPVIGELTAGIVLGPSLFNLIEPSETLHFLAEIGIILLLFEVGLDTAKGFPGEDVQPDGDQRSIGRVEDAVRPRGADQAVAAIGRSRTGRCTIALNSPTPTPTHQTRS